MESPAPLFPRIDTLVLRVRDLDRARAWYTQTLGLRSMFDDPGERLAVLDAGSCSLTLWGLKPGEAPPAEGAARAYPIFAADDADVAHAELRRRGVEPGPVQSGDGVRFFAFRDPDGNRLEACQVV